MVVLRGDQDEPLAALCGAAHQEIWGNVVHQVVEQCLIDGYA
jgi:hypothetical protein